MNARLEQNIIEQHKSEQRPKLIEMSAHLNKAH